jgi:hypothetical protein
VKRIFFAGLLCLGVAPALGAPVPKEDVQKAFFIGHNMTPTTETLKPGVATFGDYAAGVGLSDSLFVATSPWIWVSYNTANLHFKWTRPLDPQSRYGFFLSYFESYASAPLVEDLGGSTNTGRPGNGAPPPHHASINPLAVTANTPTFRIMDRYQWKSTSLHGLYSHKYDFGATTYYSLKFSYFWNDDAPYSIRMDPGSDGIRGQVDLTTLTKFPFWESFSANIEFGGLGLNYIYPYAHGGLSLAYMSKSWLVDLGASYTVQFRELGQSTAWAPGRYDGRAHTSAIDGETFYFKYLQTALHPEVQFQYFF